MTAKKQIAFIIEDSQIISSIVKKVISVYPGIEIFEFNSGEEMLMELEKTTPNIAIIDYFLAPEDQGKMNGVEVLSFLKNRNPNVYSILLTGIGDDQKIEELSAHGFDRILFKDNEDVFEYISDSIREHLN